MNDYIRVTPEELEIRIDRICELITQGKQKRDVTRWVRDESTWGISDRWAREYYNKAMERLSEEAKRVDRAAYYSLNVRRLDYIISQALDKHDLPSALRGVSDQVKLMRLDQPQAEGWEETARKAGHDPAEVKTAMQRILEAHQQLSAVENE